MTGQGQLGVWGTGVVSAGKKPFYKWENWSCAIAVVLVSALAVIF